MNNNWFSETAIAVALVASIGALVTVVIVAGPAGVVATGLKELTFGLACALAGTKIPK